MRLHYLLFLLCSSFLTLSGQQDSLQAIAYVCPPCNSQCDELTFSAIGSCSHCGMDLIDARTANTRPNQPTTVAFYLQQGVEVLDFAGPLEVLSYAGFKVFTVSRTKAPITSQGVLNVVPDYSIEDAPEADILAFFGGNGYNTSQDTAVIAWINKQTDIKLHFSVCTGALILAEAGILNGKSATTFHNAIDLLETITQRSRYSGKHDLLTTGQSFQLPEFQPALTARSIW